MAPHAVGWATYSAFYGCVGYVKGTGLDAQVALFKENLVVYPRKDWRGVYVNATCFPGPCPTDLQFPAGQGSVGAWGPYGMDPDGAGWYGSLVWAQQEQTGRQYKRNRYYDVTAGQFTQEDPIGLAGGLNLYGYANGDPVNFSDPFGLCPYFLTGKPCSAGAAIAFGFVPIAGDAYDIASAIAGKDLLTGESIGGVGIAATFIGTLAGSGKLAREGAELAADAIKRIPGNPFTGANAPAQAFAHLQKYSGLDPSVASARLHRLKHSGGLGGADDVSIGRTGDVYNARTGEHLGSLTDKSLGGK